MGVHGLWELLSPVGRRVSVETLAGKRLAIDASIWMVQFMKAMRDDKGEMIRNAHLLGFFRRICKLLYLRTKPVFVFDGGTPALKRRTVIARRRQRENAQAKIRKTAEKLLLNQLKQVRLRELADDLEKQRSQVDKGKKIVTEETDVVGSASTGTKSFADSYNQEVIDEMLAASLAAEEGGGFGAAQSSSSLPNPDQDEDADDEDEDEDEEMILPTFEGKIDPAVLASLPPSMQLDLLVQMRERLMAENRKKYQRVKKAPARFSELQIQSYLKTVAFRREIDEVQKAAAGRGIGGVQTSRIASEANREFIFSSNYKGDKLDLAPTGEGMKTNDQSRVPIINTSGSSVYNTPSSEKEGMKTNDQSRAPIVNTPGSAVNNTPSSEKNCAVSGVSTDEPEKDPKNDVETYLDERGRVRVSRVRAMGIRMTRDLQRNLDLMKENEEDRVGETLKLNNKSDNSATLGNNSGDQSAQASDEILCGVTSENATKEETLLSAGTAMEISFEGNGQHECGNDEDDLFSQLVAGNPVLNFSLDNSLSNKQSLDSGSELEWEEGDIEGEGEGVALSRESDPKGKSLQLDGLSMEEELEWEEGSLETREEAFSLPDEQKEVVSKGALAEETELQEAIRRSLQDLEHRISVDEPDEDAKSRTTVEVVSCSMHAGVTNKEADWQGREAPSRLSGFQQSDYLIDFPDNSKGKAIAAESRYAKGHDISEVYGDRQMGGVSCGDMEVLPVKECQTNPSLLDINQHADPKCSLEPEICESDTSVQQNSGCPVLTYASTSGDMVAADGHSKWTTETEKASENYPVKEVDTNQDSVEKEMHQRFINLGEEPLSKVSSSDYRKEDIDVTRANLEAEMLMLDEEYKELGNKQRKLERNAESVNSEVFAECQELLQMFGLPYIIAPMEAEAQCAYMELVDLVDGVVTDDSDVLLFGARNVYKNIFDDRKYVETYFMKDIENELGLSREKLVRMAMLLGSDYTEGISGIGIVNAIEVVNAFPEEDGLRKFREWIESPDPSILGGGLKQRETPSSPSQPDGHISGSGDDVQMKKQFMDRHRNVSKNWHIPSSFPSEAVISAYSSPQVDKSTTPFSWGKPDHYVLRKLCWEKFGWNIQKADELLLPVLTEYNKRETQLRMEAFYTFNERFAKIRSKRIKKAVKGITGNTFSQLTNESAQDDAVGTSKEKATKGKGSTNVSESGNSISTEGEICQSRSRRANVKRKSEAGGKGSDKNSSTKRARKKVSPSPKLAASCSDDEIGDEREQHCQVGSAEPCQIRRSGRPRKEVNYAVDDVEFDNPNQDEGNHVIQNTSGEEPVSEVLEEAGNSVDVPSNVQVTEHLNPEHSVECASFPLDEVKDQVGSCPTTDSVTEGQLSEDYLAMGGGFCLEEDGKDGDAQGVGDSDLSNSPIFGEDEDTAIPTRGRSSREEVENTNNNDTIISEQTMNEDDSRKGLLRPLSAMPNLKRKRRKD